MIQSADRKLAMRCAERIVQESTQVVFPDSASVNLSRAYIEVVGENESKYMDGVRDGRASLRDVLVETLEARGAKMPLGHDTDPSDLSGAVARALDERNAENERLRAALQAASDHLDFCGYGDSWESECAQAQGLEAKISDALRVDEGEKP